MISVSGKKWQENTVNKNFVKKIQQENNFSDILSKLIVSRNFDENEIYSLKNKLKLTNIFQNNSDFIRSIEILIDAINNNENVCILGDYDVDGSVATSLLVRFFENIDHPHFFYIPDREKDGYGPSKKLFKKLLIKKPKLIIMVDCGSTAIEAINFLNENNIKSIIIDHHEIYKPYPKANAIINPKKDNGYLEYDYFCATTLCYFFLEILIKKINCKLEIRKFLIYVLLATVCDVMPLRKLNRIISITALNEFNINNHFFLKELYKLKNKKKKIDINDLGYLIGPIINSGGRLGKSNFATELLSANDNKTIKRRTLDLISLNDKRKKIETTILNSIDFNQIENDNEAVIIYFKPDLNEGLIGIIASRLKDHFNKPSIVITRSNNLLKGSARSVFNYNIGRTIKNLLDKNIILNGGGHMMAAGFTLEMKNISKLKNYVINDFLKNNNKNNFTFKYDAEISTLAFNKDLFKEIKKIEPFGIGNPLPIFLFKELKVIKTKILDNKHISCILKSKTSLSINSISFHSMNSKVGEYLLNYKKNFNVMGQINENFWNNKKTLQLIIKDLIL